MDICGHLVWREEVPMGVLYLYYIGQERYVHNTYMHVQARTLVGICGQERCVHNIYMHVQARTLVGICGQERCVHNAYMDGQPGP